MVEIDGSFGEGGGQILRTAIALSVVTGKPCHIFNIRQKRENPGLRTQHLLSLRALKEISHGKLEGDFLGSREIKFIPGEKRTERIHLKIETAASITLLLQPIIIATAFSERETEIEIEGGATDTFFSPTFCHFEKVFLPILEKIGPKVELDVLKRGFYPQGGARVKVRVLPSKNPQPLDLIERGNLEEIIIYSGASESLRERKVAQRQVMGAKEVLGKLKLPLKEDIQYFPTASPGSYICLISQFKNTVLGTDNLGKLGKRAEEIGREAALNLLEEEKAKSCLDKYLSDQILPYVALLKEKSQFTVSQITNHCRTNMEIIGKFIQGRFEIKENIISWIPDSLRKLK